MADDYSTKPFSEWTLEDARAAIDAQIESDVGSQEAYEANKAYIEDGDHWQDGERWPVTHSDATIKARIRAQAAEIFCSVDAVEGCAQREVDAMLDSEPAIAYVPRKPAGADGKPSDEQVARANRMAEIQAAWWDVVQFWERMKEAALRVTYSRRGPVRLRFLPSATETATVSAGGQIYRETRLVDGLPFPDALARIHLSAPLPESALVYVQEETQERACIITYADPSDDNREIAEVWYMDGGKAVRRILSDSDEGEEPFVLDGARLPIAEMRGPLLLTESVRQQQARRDYFETLLTRIVEASGYRERYTTNAEPAGVWSLTPPSDGPPLQERQDTRGQTWYMHAAPRMLGAGVMTELQGRVYFDKDGNQQIATPGVEVFEPVDPENAIKAAKHAQFTILESCDQLHILDGDKAVSGYSKRQSRASFEKRLKRRKGSVEATIAATLEGAIANASLMTRDGDEMKDFLDEYRISVTLKINTGPLSADEAEGEMVAAEKLFKPRADVMAALGVEDTTAADGAIESDSIQRLSKRKMEGEVFTTWSTGANVESGVIASGVDGPLADAAKRTDFGTEQ